MTFVEMLTVLAILAAGYACGKCLGLYFGLVGWIGGFLLGSFLAVWAYDAVRKITGVIEKDKDWPWGRGGTH